MPLIFNKNFSFICLIIILLLSIQPFQTNANEHIAKIIVIGPGINTIQLPFPSRYFFILHQDDLKLGLIELKTAKSFKNINQKSNCFIRTQVFNQTRFCIHLSRSYVSDLISKSETLNEILNISEYCDDEIVQKQTDSSMIKYWLTIVRFNFHRGHWKCNQPLELVIYKENDNQVPIYRRLIANKNNEPFYSEHCSCQRNDWYKLNECDSNNNQKLQQQIFNDLQSFGSGIDFATVLDEARNRFGKHPQTYAFCHYSIRDNKAYKRCYGQYDGFSKFFDRMLLSLMRKTHLSDNDFLMNLGDWPLSNKHDTKPLPIFSWCGSQETNDIVLPTYELTESILNGHDRIDTDIQSVFGKQNLSFLNKINRLFWRGRDSNEVRLKLIDQSYEMPDYFDVAITNFFFFRDRMKKYRPESNSTKIPYVPFKDFFNYRYQINLDGTVAAYRLPFLLSGNSLILKQKSKYYEFFYHLLRPNEHLIEIDEQIEELPNLLKNLIENNGNYDIESIKKIIWQSRIFVLKYLMPSSIYCYYYQALESYSKLLLMHNNNNQKQIYDDSMSAIDDNDDLNYYGTCPNGCEQDIYRPKKFPKEEL